MGFNGEHYENTFNDYLLSDLTRQLRKGTHIDSMDGGSSSRALDYIDHSQ